MLVPLLLQILLLPLLLQLSKNSLQDPTCLPHYDHLDLPPDWTWQSKRRREGDRNRTKECPVHSNKKNDLKWFQFIILFQGDKFELPCGLSEVRVGRLQDKEYPNSHQPSHNTLLQYAIFIQTVTLWLNYLLVTAPGGKSFSECDSQLLSEVRSTSKQRRSCFFVAEVPRPSFSLLKHGRIFVSS